MKLAENKSIIFENTFPVLFNDLDQYGHMNSSRYMDYLNSSRLLYPRDEFGLDDKFFISIDLGFYVRTIKAKLPKTNHWIN